MNPGYYTARHLRSDILVHIDRTTTNPDGSLTLWAGVIRGDQPTILAGDIICLRTDEIIREATTEDFDKFRVVQPQSTLI